MSIPDVLSAMRGRRSVRAFLDKPVSDSLIEQILEAASWAPSGVNTQPWQIAVVSGHKKAEISKAIVETYRSGKSGNPDYAYYPQEWTEPYKTRRFACGMALYGALGIERKETKRRQEVWEENYRFFDAPVGLFFLIDASLEKGSWLDMGMFLQNVMLAARGVGLETCAQAALSEYPDIVRKSLELPENVHVICGMALGYENPTHPVNQYRTSREPVSSFTRWYK